MKEKTLIVLAVVSLLVTLAFWGAVSYVAFHFITKYW